MQNDDAELSFCPSFNSYSNNKLVDMAGAVVGRDREINGDVSDDEEFEFFKLYQNIEALSFPIFDRDLLLNSDGKEVLEVEAIPIPVPLTDLYIDGDILSSSTSSSSEADELERVPAGTYCVWTPNQSPESSPNRCKKSNSTGSSSRELKRWSLKNLLKRSNSENKISSPSSSSSFLVRKITEKTLIAKKKIEGEEKATTIKRVNKVSAHEAFYMRNKALKEVDKRRSYLPYRQDLVGIFVRTKTQMNPKLTTIRY